MDINLSSDQPVITETEDKFQRFNFSKRIAQTIIDRKSNDCLVVGVYGAWGEGKTSVLNFIESELLNEKDNIVILKFNPWRYIDENELLTQFFNQLATSVNAKLKTNKENFGALLSKYGKLMNIPLVGDFSATVAAAGNILNENNLEVTKERISSILTESNQKIVVLIDDIDRLDKTEIYSIFKLVKLNADFSNTVYLLSFDDKMVSAAISERFSAEDKNAGHNFLEKIVHVPLRIPMAQPIALREFSMELVNQVLDVNKIVIKGREADRFAEHFANALLTRLYTPRMAVQYSNMISFAIPLLMDETNIVDMLLIEGIKVFYPGYYEFIRYNPNYFTETYDEASMLIGAKEKKEQITKYLDELGQPLSIMEKKGINALLFDLFPSLQEAYNSRLFDHNSREKWYSEKRVGDKIYFPRYFSYAVIKDDVSDTILNNLIYSIKNCDELDSVILLTEIVNKTNAVNFIRKLRAKEQELEWSQAKPLAIALANAVVILHEAGIYYGVFSSLTAFGQAGIFISKLLWKHRTAKDCYEVAKRIITTTPLIDFAFELHRWINTYEDENRIFSQKQLSGLSEALLKRAIKNAGKVPLYDFYPAYNFTLYNIWVNYDPDGLKKKFADIIARNKKAYLKVIYGFTSTIAGNTSENPYSNFNIDSFKFLNSLMDTKLIALEIENNYKEEEYLGQANFDIPFSEPQSDINVVRQFMHWYKNANSTENNNVAKK